MRELSPKEKIKVFKNKNPKFIAPQTNFHPQTTVNDLNIQIKKTEAITGIYLLVAFDDTTKIQQSFKEIIQLATANDLLFDNKKLYGIFSPHQCNVYKTFIAISKHQHLANKFNVTGMKAGKYATFKIKGDKKETLKAAQYFYHKWLPESSYKIADVTGFELFTESPATTPYNKLQREFYIPVEPI